MKRISAAKNACLAAAGLVATAALAYGMAFVVWAPVKRVENYAAMVKKLEVRVELNPVTPPDVSAVWTALPPPVVIRTERFDATLAGTSVSPDPTRSLAAVNSSTGQSLVRVGDRFQSARVDAISTGSALFTLGGRTIPLMITRSEK